MLVKTCGVFLLDRDNQLLICHPTGKSDFGNVWSIPKGLQDDGERDEETAVRELLEETGIEIEEEELFFIGKNKYKNKNKVLYAYFIKLNKYKKEIKLFCDSTFKKNNIYLPEIDKYNWVNLNDAELLLHSAQIPFIEIIRMII